MPNIEFTDLLSVVVSYSEEDKEKIKKAYHWAKRLHQGQKRNSGEDYIIHPLNVALIVAKMHADADTICASLLHDTLEDTAIIKEDIELGFNKDVANLVNGVTKISKMNFSSPQEESSANTRKIIISIAEDVRIIIIKLADRLHNMRTLQYKTPFKQRENALETMEIYVPLAYYIGAYQIKSELEDLSLRYLHPDIYQEIREKRQEFINDSSACLAQMLYKIKMALENRDIPSFLKYRIKNIYGIYQKQCEGKEIVDIHDLLALKVIVDEVDSCYRSLGVVHSIYRPMHDRIRDYICSPKPNQYQSLHTTVFGADERLVHVQIKTQNMERVANHGLTVYWAINNSSAREEMQEALREKYQFYDSLIDIDASFGNNQDFVEKIKNELFAGKIWVYTTQGNTIELPIGSTVIDFAYRIHTEVGNTMIGALVNDVPVGFDYVLKNNDRVKIITDKLSVGPDSNWENIATTTKARRYIRDFRRKREN